MPSLKVFRETRLESRTGIFLPYHLFTLTSISCGTYVRVTCSKCDRFSSNLTFPYSISSYRKICQIAIIYVYRLPTMSFFFILFNGNLFVHNYFHVTYFTTNKISCKIIRVSATLKNMVIFVLKTLLGAIVLSNKSYSELLK